MRSSAIAFAAVAALVLCGVSSSPAKAQPAREQQRVAVDWSAVSDADVARCGLSRLRAGTIERLVEDGHAVVEDSGEGGLRVVVASAGADLRVQVSAGAIMQEDSIALGPDCDATLTLESIARISELVDGVARETRELAAQAAPEPESPRSEPAAEPQAPADRAGVEAAIAASARASAGPYVLLGGAAIVRARPTASLEAGVQIELTGNGEGGVTVLEAQLALTAAYQPALPGLGIVVELGPLLHSGASDVRSVLELDASLGAGAQLSLGHLLAQLVFYVRLRSLEHRAGSDIAFETGRFGLILRIGAQLFGS
jgi:hypothetical protein